MSQEVSHFELEQLRASLTASDAEVREFRGTLSSTIFCLESEMAEVKGKLEMERLRRWEVEQLFGRLHADQYPSIAALWDVYLRINEDMDVFGLQPFVPYSSFDEGKLNHLTFFFQDLVAKLGELCHQVTATQEAEVDRVTRVVASRILACVHYATPSFPVELVLEDFGVEDRRKVEREVADVAEAGVQMEKENDFGNA